MSCLFHLIKKLYFGFKFVGIDNITALDFIFLPSLWRNKIVRNKDVKHCMLLTIVKLLKTFLYAHDLVKWHIFGIELMINEHSYEFLFGLLCLTCWHKRNEK